MTATPSPLPTPTALDLSSIPQWAPVAVAFAAAVGVALTILGIVRARRQAKRDIAESANSVLIQEDPTKKGLLVANAGTKPIHAVVVYVNDRRLASNREALSIRQGDHHPFELDAGLDLTGLFPQRVYVDFSDAGGHRWRKYPHRQATDGR